MLLLGRHISESQRIGMAKDIERTLSEEGHSRVGVIMSDKT